MGVLQNEFSRIRLTGLSLDLTRNQLVRPVQTRPSTHLLQSRGRRLSSSVSCVVDSVCSRCLFFSLFSSSPSPLQPRDPLGISCFFVLSSFTLITTCSITYYLASSASSWAAECKFSSAANVCSSGWGILKPRKIERCVSSHMWLKQGVQVTGKFEKAQKIFKNYVDFSQKTSKKYFYFYLTSIILYILYSPEKNISNIYILFINFLLI
ncbi:hypothetical protein VP01_448g5 [Puccinia sorghi]|uniref:Uncharacterized protein n=1 Tax=Puccinia sorghi TaxID=27349 RepID=A0A0L6UP76_9BASI|nr:hypothetical protein VP01_448g5 [Puccinia sorghi]